MRKNDESVTPKKAAADSNCRFSWEEIQKPLAARKIKKGEILFKKI